MTKEQLFDAIGETEERYIRDAGETKKKRTDLPAVWGWCMQEEPVPGGPSSKKRALKKWPRLEIFQPEAILL